MDRWGEALFMLIIGGFLIIGMVWGVKAIFVIAPLIIIIVYLFFRLTNGPSLKYLSKKKIKDDTVEATLKVSGGLICVIFILLFLGSCINGCTERNPNNPKDLELKYKIWRHNNPY